MDKEGKGYLKYTGVFPMKKDSGGNQFVAHKDSSSPVQENESSPAVLPYSLDLNKSVEEMTVADVGVWPPPKVLKEGTSSSPNRISKVGRRHSSKRRPRSLPNIPVLGGHATVAEYDVSKKKDSQIVTNQGSSSSVQVNLTAPTALLDNSVDLNISPSLAEEDAYFPPPQEKEATPSSPNRRSSDSRKLHQCRYCETDFYDFWSKVTHEKSVHTQPDYRRRVSAQYNNNSPRYTTPITSRSPSPQLGQTELGFDFSPLLQIPPVQFKSFKIDGDNSAAIERMLQQVRTDLTLSISEGVNDGCIDLFSRVIGTSGKLENQEHDQDYNNENDDGTLDLLSRVGRESSK